VLQLYLQVCNNKCCALIVFSLFCAMSGKKVVQGMYDYTAAADTGMPVQDLNFKKGDYMVVLQE